MTLVKVDRLWKEYPGKTVLERLDLKVSAGEFVTIVGASGCGKTTFLRMLLGAETPTRGSIQIDGVALAPEPTRERGIVFQRYSVFPHLTVLANVVLGLELQTSKLFGRAFGATKRKLNARAMDMLERVGLTASAKQYPSALSGGMQQRLALAQTLIAEPRILLLDEPFGALDPGIRGDMHELVTELHQELGLTVFMITHDIGEGFKLGTRLLVFDKWRHDPHDPDAYGATITFDLPVERPTTLATVIESTQRDAPSNFHTPSGTQLGSQLGAAGARQPPGDPAATTEARDYA